MVRGTVILPHGTGKTARVIVFATGAAPRRPRSPPAPTRSAATSSSRGPGGWLDFDAAVSTPELMGQVGRLGKVLGPRGLMPNPKTGTVTRTSPRPSPRSRAARSSSASTSTPTCTSSSARPAFTTEQLDENYAAALDEVVRLKPAAAKGRYIQKGAVSTTFGPGIPLDVNKTRNLEEETVEA